MQSYTLNFQYGYTFRSRGKTNSNSTNGENGLVVRYYLIIMVLLSLLTQLHGQGIPTSTRSQKAVLRNTPTIQAQLDSARLSLGSQIYIRAFKNEDTLEVWLKKDEGFKLFKSYRICYYSGNLGPKQKQGDDQVPEGFYYVKPRNLNPWSKFHLSFNIGYPNRYDRRYQRTGGAIMIHGNCVSIGCLAMTDPVIEEIYTLVDAAFRHGQPFFRVHIFPFRMTVEKMTKYRDSEWYPFWVNLKEGYDIFETSHMPPNVEVSGEGHYTFGPQ